MTKIAGSGSFSQRHGSADPDPHQNAMDPQHWYLGSTLTSRVLVRLDSLRYCWMSLTTSADSISIDILHVYLGNKLAFCKRKMFYWCRNSRIARKKNFRQWKAKPPSWRQCCAIRIRRLFDPWIRTRHENPESDFRELKKILLG